MKRQRDWFSPVIRSLLLIFISGCGTHPQSSPSVTHTQQVIADSPKPPKGKAEQTSDPKVDQTSKGSTHRLYHLLEKYRGEEQLGVKYFSTEERRQYRVSVKNGLLCDHTGHPLDPELDLPQFAHRNGKAIFVIDPKRQIWITFDQRYGKVHHSSLLAGRPVIAAGELVIEHGQLLSISNASGHYKPDPESLDVAWHILKELGVILSQTERFVVQKPSP